MAQYSFPRLQAEYGRLWSEMHVTKTAAATAQARRIISGKSRYKEVEAKTGVPWFVVGCMHMRESSGNFSTWLHNGDPMRHDGMPVRTVQVPRGRPPNPNCTWEDGAKDALVNVEHLDTVKSWGVERVAYALELFNGFGYRHPDRNIPSPYLWGGTSVQRPGKFVRDHVYDSHVVDPQLGGMAVLRLLMEIDPEARFSGEPVPAPIPTPTPKPRPPVIPKPPKPAPPPPPPKPSPKAGDDEGTVKPLTKSKTIWGGIVGFITAAASTISGMVSNLSNPYALAAFLALLAVAGVAAYLVFKGRADVQKVVEHLSEDNGEMQ